MMGMISPSMMCVDFTAIKETVAAFEKNGIEYLHIDIMDGVFVPNFTLGTDFCRKLKQITSIPLDIHLMIDEPERKLDWFPVGEGDIVSIHTESTKHLQKALAAVKAKGAKAYPALCPATPLQVLDYVTDVLDGVLVMTVNPGFAGQKLIPATLNKITDVRNYLDAHGRQDALIEVDGNVSFENAVKMKNAGADIYVAGTSSVFAKDMTLEEGIARLRACVTRE